MSQSGIRLLFRSSRSPQPLRDASAFFQNARQPLSFTSRHPSTPHTSIARPRATQLRLFSSTRVRNATIVTKNPRNDDDGAAMTITISENAAKRLKQITSTPQKRNTLATSSITPDSHLRVTVTSGGCHGFQYLMSLEPEAKIDPEEDTVFVADDAAGEGRAEVVMDEPSLELLKGSTVDFVTELIGSQFKIVGNPRATSSCGCGTSFDVQ